MTTDRSDRWPAAGAEEGAEAPILPDELLAARDRQARHRVAAGRAEEGQRLRRRYLPAALVGASVLALAGIADRYVSGAVAQPSAAAAPTTTTTTTSPSAATLAQVASTLAADRRAIAALVQAQARLAQKAAEGGGGSSALPAVQLPSLPSLPSASSIAVAPVPAPVTHATTGASVVVP